MITIFENISSSISHGIKKSNHIYKQKKHIFILILLSYFLSCASFFGYNNQNYNNTKNQNVPEVVYDPLDLSKYPNYRSNKSRKELVLHILKNYCPDGFYIVNKKKSGTNDNFMKSYFPENRKVTVSKKIDMPEKYKKIMKTNILKQMGTYVHESNHHFHYTFHQKYFQKNNLYGAHSFFSYYAGNGKTFLVYKNKTFPSREIYGIFPGYMLKDRNLSFRVTTYVYPSQRSQSTQVEGIFGLLDELYSYYHGCLSSYQLLPYVKRKKGNAAENIKDYLIGVDSVRYAYHEFKLYILLYLMKAKTDYPMVYKQLLKNKRFINAFLYIDIKFKKLNRRYEAARRKLKPWLKARGYILKIEKKWTRVSTVRKRKFNGYSSSTSYGHFDQTVKAYEKEMRKKKYLDILNILKNQVKTKQI